MRYMLLIYNCDRPAPADPGFAEALARVNAYADELRRRGALVEGDPLPNGNVATSVSVRDGRTLITDGPFVETREHLGGYYILECRDLDEAVELATRCPMAEVGTVEVRPVAHVPGVDNSRASLAVPAE